MTSSAGLVPKPARDPYPAAANTCLSRSVRNWFQTGSDIDSLSNCGCSTIAVFFPRIAFVVIAAHFPEAGAVFHREFDPGHPFRALPEIPVRDDHTHRPAMLAGDGLALPGMGEQDTILFEDLAFHIGGVAVIGMEQDMARLGLGSREFEDVARRHAPPMIVVAAPLRDAVDVRNEILLRLRQEFVERPDDLVFDEAANLKAPILGAYIGL